MTENKLKKSFYPDNLDASTDKGLSEVMDYAIPLVTDMFNTLGSIPPTFIIGIRDNLDEHYFILMSVGKKEAMDLVPFVLHELGERLGRLKQVNEIKQVDYCMFFSESTQVKIDTSKPEEMNVQKKLKGGMKISDVPESMKKEAIVITGANLHNKMQLRNLEVKQSINFIDKEMMSSTKSLHLETNTKDADKMNNIFSEMFFDSYAKGQDHKTNTAKKFKAVLKAMGATNEYEAILRNNKTRGMDTDAINSQIALATSEIPEELRKLLIIKLAK